MKNSLCRTLAQAMASGITADLRRARSVMWSQCKDPPLLQPGILEGSTTTLLGKALGQAAPSQLSVTRVHFKGLFRIYHKR